MDTKIIDTFIPSSRNTELLEPAVKVTRDNVSNLVSNRLQSRYRFSEAQLRRLKYFYPNRLIFQGYEDHPHPVDATITYDLTRTMLRYYPGKPYYEWGGIPDKVIAYSNSDVSHCAHITSKATFRDSGRFLHSIQKLERIIASTDLRSSKFNAREYDFMNQCVYTMRTGIATEAMCLDGFENCKHYGKAEMMICRHASYHTPLQEFIEAMEVAGITHALVLMHLPFCIEKQGVFDDGVYRVTTGPVYSTMEFSGDPSNAYVHETEVWLTWFKTTLVATKKGNYHVEFKERKGFTHIIEIVFVQHRHFEERSILQNLYSKHLALSYRRFDCLGYIAIPDANQLLKALKEGKSAGNFIKKGKLKHHWIMEQSFKRIVSMLESLEAGKMTVQETLRLIKVHCNDYFFAGSMISNDSGLAVEDSADFALSLYLFVAIRRYLLATGASQLMDQLKKDQELSKMEGFSALFSKAGAVVGRWWQRTMTWLGIGTETGLYGIMNFTSTSSQTYWTEVKIVNPAHAFLVRRSIQEPLRQIFKIRTDEERTMMYINSLENCPEKELQDLFAQSLSVARRVEFCPFRDRIQFVIGPPGCGKTTSILLEWKAEGEETNTKLFVAPSAAFANEMKARPEIGLCHVMTQHTAITFAAKSVGINEVVIDEAFTQPIGYIGCLASLYPAAKIILLGDPNQCTLYDPNGGYAASDNIENLRTHANTRMITDSYSVPKNMVIALRSFGCPMQTKSEKHGTFQVLPLNLDKFKAAKLKMVFSTKTKEKFLADDPQCGVVTIREAQGMRTTDAAIYIATEDESMVKSQHDMFFVMLTRSTDTTIVYLDRKINSKSVNFGNVDLLDGLFKYTGFMPYEDGHLVAESLRLTYTPVEGVEAPLVNDVVLVTNIMKEITKATAPDHIAAMVPTHLYTASDNYLKISSKIHNQDDIEIKGYALPYQSYCKHFIGAHKLQTLETICARNTNNRRMNDKVMKDTLKLKDILVKNFVEDCLKPVDERVMPTIDSRIMNYITEYLEVVQTKKGEKLLKTFDPEERSQTIVMYHLKQITKYMAEDAAAAAKAGQGISAWPKPLNAVMTCMMRYFDDLIRLNLVEKIKMGHHYTVDQLGVHYAALMHDKDQDHCSMQNINTDLSQFDASQSPLSIALEKDIMAELNVEGPLVDFYFAVRTEWKISCPGVAAATMVGQKASGEPGTLIMNSVLSLAYTASVINLKTADLVYNLGDDNSLAGEELRINVFGSRIVSEVMNAEVKIETGSVMPFCGNLYTQKGVVPMLPKVLSKTTSRIHKDEDDWAEHQQSVVDRLKLFNLGDPYIASANAMYYDVPAAEMMILIGFLRWYAQTSWPVYSKLCMNRDGYSGKYVMFVDHDGNHTKTIPKPDLAVAEELEMKTVTDFSCRLCGGEDTDPNCKKVKNGSYCHTPRCGRKVRTAHFCSRCTYGIVKSFKIDYCHAENCSTLTNWHSENFAKSFCWKHFPRASKEVWEARLNPNEHRSESVTTFDEHDANDRAELLAQAEAEIEFTGFKKKDFDLQGDITACTAVKMENAINLLRFFNIAKTSVTIMGAAADEINLTAPMTLAPSFHNTFSTFTAVDPRYPMSAAEFVKSNIQSYQIPSHSLVISDIWEDQGNCNFAKILLDHAREGGISLMKFTWSTFDPLIFTKAVEGIDRLHFARFAGAGKSSEFWVLAWGYRAGSVHDVQYYFESTLDHGVSCSGSEQHAFHISAEGILASCCADPKHQLELSFHTAAEVTPSKTPSYVSLKTVELPQPVKEPILTPKPTMAELKAVKLNVLANTFKPSPENSETEKPPDIDKIPVSEAFLPPPQPVPPSCRPPNNRKIMWCSADVLKQTHPHRVEEFKAAVLDIRAKWPYKAEFNEYVDIEIVLLAMQRLDIPCDIYFSQMEDRKLTACPYFFGKSAKVFFHLSDNHYTSVTRFFYRSHCLGKSSIRPSINSSDYNSFIRYFIPEIT